MGTEVFKKWNNICGSSQYKYTVVFIFKPHGLDVMTKYLCVFTANLYSLNPPQFIEKTGYGQEGTLSWDHGLW